MSTVKKQGRSDIQGYEKQRANDDKAFTSVIFDLQLLLQVPSLDAHWCTTNENSAATTLQFLNRLNLVMPSVIVGQRLMEGSNEIGSCLLQYLKRLPKSDEEISIFPDTCTCIGQNLNQNITAVLFYALITLQIHKHFNKSSPICAWCGLIIMPPCENTSSTGADVIGTLNAARKTMELKSSWFIWAVYLVNVTSADTSVLGCW